MKPPEFRVDRFWLERLAMGVGRDERLDGMQRHFVRVVDGNAQPIGSEEKASLAEYHRIKAGFAPVSPAGDALDSGELSEALSQALGLLDPSKGERETATAPSAPTTMDPAMSARVLEVRQRAAASHGRKHQDGSWTKTAGSTLRQATDAAKSGLRMVGDAMDGVVGARGEVQRNVDVAMNSTGRAVQGAGVGVARASKSARAAVGRAGDSSREAVDEVAARLAAEGRGTAAAWMRVGGRSLTALVEAVGKAAAGATELTAIAVASAGAKTAKHSETIGVAMAGTVVGAAGMVGGAADAVGVTDEEIRTVQQQLKMARMAYGVKREAYVAALVQRYPGKRDCLMDQFTIGGLTLSELIASRRVPEEIAAAYAAAYPVESGLMDFRDKVDSLSSGDELEGLVNGVKGKLFEMKYVDELNAGGLPDGWHAVLATSATQPGWDLQIVDRFGTVQEMISAKATEHVSYINEALHRYPDIDVVTTSEVYAAMAGTAEGANLIDGGVSHVEVLEATQDAAAGHAAGLDVAVLSALALGPAAYTHFANSNKPMAERTAGFTRHAGRAKTASMMGSAAMVALPFWPVAFLTATGLSLAASVGNNKREQLHRLEALRDQVRAAGRAQHQKLVTLKAPSQRSLR
jgi:hypothetical protein